MGKSLIAVVAVVAAVLAAFVTASGAPAGDGVTECADWISGSPTETLTITGSVHVVPGAHCVLLFVNLTGSVLNQGGGSLEIFGSTVGGNVVSRQALWVNLIGAEIKGNVEVAGTTGLPMLPPEPWNFICDSTVGGNLRLHGNQAPIGVGVVSGCAPGPNVIGGNVTVHNNGAVMSVSGNTIGGMLFCHNDDPVATGEPGSNTAAKKLGECAGF